MNARKLFLFSLVSAGIIFSVSSVQQTFDVFVASNRGISQPKLSYLVRQTVKPPTALRRERGHNTNNIPQKPNNLMSMPTVGPRVQFRRKAMKNMFNSNSNSDGGYSYNSNRGQHLDATPRSKQSLSGAKRASIDSSSSSFSNRNVRSSKSRSILAKMFKKIRGFRDIVPPNNRLQRSRDISSYWPDIANDKLQPIGNDEVYQEEDFRVFRGNGNVFLPPTSTSGPVIYTESTQTPRTRSAIYTESTQPPTTRHAIYTESSQPPTSRHAFYTESTPTPTTQKDRIIATQPFVVTKEEESVTKTVAKEIVGEHKIETFSGSDKNQHKLPIHYNVLNPSTESVPDRSSSQPSIATNPRKSNDSHDLVVSFVKYNKTSLSNFSFEDKKLSENIKDINIQSSIDETLKGKRKKSKEPVHIVIHKFPYNISDDLFKKGNKRSRGKKHINHGKLYKHFLQLTKPIPLNQLTIKRAGVQVLNKNENVVNRYKQIKKTTPLGREEESISTSTTPEHQKVQKINVSSRFNSNTETESTTNSVFDVNIRNTSKSDRKQANNAQNNKYISKFSTSRSQEKSNTGHRPTTISAKNIDSTVFSEELKSKNNPSLTTIKNKEHTTEPVFKPSSSTKSKSSRQQDTTFQRFVTTSSPKIQKTTVQTTMFLATTTQHVISSTQINNTTTKLKTLSADEILTTKEVTVSNSVKNGPETFSEVLSAHKQDEVKMTRTISTQDDNVRENVDKKILPSKTTVKVNETQNNANNTFSGGDSFDLDVMSDYIEEFVHLKNATKNKNHRYVNVNNAEGFEKQNVVGIKIEEEKLKLLTAKMKNKKSSFDDFKMTSLRGNGGSMSKTNPAENILKHTQSASQQSTTPPVKLTTEVLLSQVNATKNKGYLTKVTTPNQLNEAVPTKNTIKTFSNKAPPAVTNTTVGILSGVTTGKTNIKIKDNSVVLDPKINNSVDFVQEKEQTNESVNSTTEDGKHNDMHLKISDSPANQTTITTTPKQINEPVPTKHTIKTFSNRAPPSVTNTTVGILRDVTRGRKNITIKVKSDKSVILNPKIKKSVDIVHKKEPTNETVISTKENREHNDTQLKILDSPANKTTIIKDANITTTKGSFFDDRKNNLASNDSKIPSNFPATTKRGIRTKHQIKNQHNRKSKREKTPNITKNESHNSGKVKFFKLNERGKDKSLTEVIAEKKNNRSPSSLDITNVEERNEKNFEDNSVKKRTKIPVKKLKVKQFSTKIKVTRKNIERMKSKTNKSSSRKTKTETNVKPDIGQKNMSLINDLLVNNASKTNDLNVNTNAKSEAKTKNVKLQERPVINATSKTSLSRSNKSRQNRLPNRKKNNKSESKPNQSKQVNNLQDKALPIDVFRESDFSLKTNASVVSEKERKKLKDRRKTPKKAESKEIREIVKGSQKKKNDIDIPEIENNYKTSRRKSPLINKTSKTPQDKGMKRGNIRTVEMNAQKVLKDVYKNIKRKQEEDNSLVKTNNMAILKGENTERNILQGQEISIETNTENKKLAKDINVSITLRKAPKTMRKNISVEKPLQITEKRDNNKNIKVNMTSLSPTWKQDSAFNKTVRVEKEIHTIHTKTGAKSSMDNKGKNLGFLEKVKNATNKKLISLMSNTTLQNNTSMTKVESSSNLHLNISVDKQSYKSNFFPKTKKAFNVQVKKDQTVRENITAFKIVASSTKGTTFRPIQGKPITANVSMDVTANVPRTNRPQDTDIKETVNTDTPNINKDKNAIKKSILAVIVPTKMHMTKVDSTTPSLFVLSQSDATPFTTISTKPSKTPDRQSKKKVEGRQKYEKSPEKNQIVIKDDLDNNLSIEIPLDLVTTTRPNVNAVDISNEVLVPKLSSTKVKKEIDRKPDHNSDKRSDIKVVSNTPEIPTNRWRSKENVGLKSRIDVKTRQAEKSSMIKDLKQLIPPPPPVIPTATVATATENIIRFIGKASDLIKKLNGKKHDLQDLMSHKNMGHLDGNTIQPVFKLSKTEQNIDLIMSKDTTSFPPLQSSTTPENVDGSDKDLGKGQRISAIFTRPEVDVENGIRPSAFDPRLNNVYDFDVPGGISAKDVNGKSSPKGNQPFVEWLARGKNGQIKDIPPEILTKTKQVPRRKVLDPSNSAIPDILKSNLDSKTYSKPKMPFMNPLRNLQKYPHSGSCNSSLGKEEIMSLAVNVLRLLVSNLKLQQALQRSHEHIVSTQFHSRRYLLIPLPEDGQKANKTSQQFYPKIGKYTLPSSNSLQHQIETFLNVSSLNANLALSPLVKSQSLRSDRNQTLISHKHEENVIQNRKPGKLISSMTKKRQLRHKDSKAVFDKIAQFFKRESMQSNAENLDGGTHSVDDKESVSSKARIQFH
ncbi:serine-rich adhesin for platelets-like [Magallana gigas]|uniref:serine-rich adhesin for platelets-like n=1 Tax=Magallana gigas TaxID=29159 RepID=UPI00333ED848